MRSTAGGGSPPSRMLSLSHSVPMPAAHHVWPCTLAPCRGGNRGQVALASRCDRPTPGGSAVSPLHAGRGLVHQQGDHRDVTLQGRLDLDADVIPRIVHPPPTRRVGFSQPSGADDDQEDIAPGDRVLQDPAKIPTERDRIYILEYVICTELPLEPIVDTIGDVMAVLGR